MRVRLKKSGRGSSSSGGLRRGLKGRLSMGVLRGVFRALARRGLSGSVLQARFHHKLPFKAPLPPSSLQAPFKPLQAPSSPFKPRFKPPFKPPSSCPSTLPPSPRAPPPLQPSSRECEGFDGASLDPRSVKWTRDPDGLATQTILSLKSQRDLRACVTRVDPVGQIASSWIKELCGAAWPRATQTTLPL